MNKNYKSAFRGVASLITLAVLLSACVAFQPPRANLPSREGIVPGETITVEGNKNVYGVAHEHNVSMRDLIVLNNLQPPFNLHNGQKLTLPAPPGALMPTGDMTAAEAMPPPGQASVGTVEQTELPPIQSAPISSAPLSRGSVTYTNTPKPAVKSSTTPSAETLTTPSPHQTVPTTAAATGEEVASINPSEASPPPDVPSGNFVWPVQGPVLSGYGPKGQGLSNDGVNIGAPKGAPVVAAGAGIVVYAGNEMKGFGNLVLIRHQGGWVTAYAHLDRVLVAKDAVVAQGDEIGTVGKSGNVDRPQVHFETRYDGKTVDPANIVKAQ